MSHNKGRCKPQPRRVDAKNIGLWPVKGSMDGRNLFLTDNPNLRRGTIIQVIDPETGPVIGRTVKITSRPGCCGSYGNFKFAYSCSPT
jgi:hypothetical protein